MICRPGNFYSLAEENDVNRQKTDNSIFSFSSKCSYYSPATNNCLHSTCENSEHDEAFRINYCIGKRSCICGYDYDVLFSVKLSSVIYYWANLIDSIGNRHKYVQHCKWTMSCASKIERLPLHSLHKLLHWLFGLLWRHFNMHKDVNWVLRLLIQPPCAVIWLIHLDSILTKQLLFLSEPVAFSLHCWIRQFIYATGTCVFHSLEISWWWNHWISLWKWDFIKMV